MSGQEFIIALVAIVSGSVVLIVGISCITGLIKSWLKRGKKSEFSDEQFRKLAKAFTQYKKDTERRLQNLEAIVTDETLYASEKTLEQSHKSIEIEDETEENAAEVNKNNLKNMLRE